MGAAVTQIAALLAARDQFYNPAIGIMCILVTIVGFGIAIRLRTMGAGTQLLRVGAVALFLLAVFLLSTRFVIGPIATFDFRQIAEQLILGTLAVVAAVGTMILVTDESIPFVGVWGLAIVGLSATSDINLNVIIFFAIFLYGFLFVLVHSYALSQAPSHSRYDIAQGTYIRRQLGMASILWAFVLLLGFLISIPVRMIGKNMSLAQVVNQLRVENTPVQARGMLLDRLSEGGGTFGIGLGPLRDDQTPIMKVTIEEPRLLRGRTYGLYTGRAWTTEQFRLGKEVFGSREDNGLATYVFGKRIDSIPVTSPTIKYKVKAEDAVLALVYIAGDPVRLTVASNSLYETPEGNLGAYAYLREYSLEARPPTSDPAILNATASTYVDDIRPFLAVPSNPSIQKHVDAALQGVTGGPYANAEAIRRYVAGHSTYSLQAPRVPAGRDPVEYFLNESSVGYCDLYASSVAIMCRMAGLPSRIATGFNGGELDPNIPNQYQIRESNRHAWAEVYFTGQGWVPFDATANTQEVANTAQPGVARVARSYLARLTDFLKSPFVFTLPAILFIVAAFIRPQYRQKYGISLSRSPSVRKVVGAYMATEAALRRAGVSITPASTIAEVTSAGVEFIERHTVSEPRVIDALEKLSALITGNLYGAKEPSDADVATARECAKIVITTVRKVRVK